MYIDQKGPIIKCGRCGSLDYESVQHGAGQYAVSFTRCRGCGHESEHKPLFPRTETVSNQWPPLSISGKPDVQTF